MTELSISRKITAVFPPKVAEINVHGNFQFRTKLITFSSTLRESGKHEKPNFGKNAKSLCQVPRGHGVRIVASLNERSYPGKSLRGALAPLKIWPRPCAIRRRAVEACELPCKGTINALGKTYPLVREYASATSVCIYRPNRSRGCAHPRRLRRHPKRSSSSFPTARTINVSTQGSYSHDQQKYQISEFREKPFIVLETRSSSSSKGADNFPLSFLSIFRAYETSLNRWILWDAFAGFCFRLHCDGMCDLCNRTRLHGKFNC